MVSVIDDFKTVAERFISVFAQVGVRLLDNHSMDQKPMAIVGYEELAYI